MQTRSRRRRRRARRRASRRITLLAIATAVHLTVAARADRRPEPGTEWLVQGTFQGLTGTGFRQFLGNWIFEEEREGSLYDDLGNLTLGVGADVFDEGKLEWDNSMRRRVVLAQEQLAPGSQVGASDLSTYLDVQSALTRGRLTYSYLPDLVGSAGVGIRVEGGAALALSRRAPPIRLADRPLDDVLAERREQRRSGELPWPEASPQKSLLHNTAVGIRRFVELVEHALTRRFEDTERSAIFYEGYAEPLTLFLDLGMPVDYDLFRSEDRRLSPGDVVTEVSFFGANPVDFGYRTFAFRSNARRFFRFLRETTIRKESDDAVTVQVRNVFSQGREIIPAKVRPELRLLLVLRLGYTFGEIQYEVARQLESTIAYRIDLSRPDGEASLRHLLGRAGGLSLRPVLAASERGDGVEILDTSVQRGRQRRRLLKLRLPGLLRWDGRKSTRTYRIHTSDGDRREVALTRGRQWKRIARKGKSASSRITIQGLTDAVETPDGRPAPMTGLLLEDGFSFSRLDPHEIRRFLGAADQILGHHPSSPVPFIPSESIDEAGPLDALLRLRFAPQHLRRLRQVSEDELWSELARLLLGPEYASVWSTPQRRRAWRPRPRRLSTDRHPSVALDRVRGEALSPAQRIGAAPQHADSFYLYLEAVDLARRFRSLRRAMLDPGCLRCLVRFQGARQDSAVLQALLVGLAGGVDGGVGYRFEVVAPSLPGPLSARSRRPAARPETFSAPRATPDAAEVALSWQQGHAEPVQPRLDSGQLLLRRAPGSHPSEEPCWKLRLFSTLRFGSELRLRADLRRSRVLKDREVTGRPALLPMSEPRELAYTPDQPSLFMYEFPLPWADRLQADRVYYLLLRVLNGDGYPVSEEQAIRFSVPSSWSQETSGACGNGGATEAAGRPTAGTLSNPAGR